MNRISLYIFLILIYLGISKSFSPDSDAGLYIFNQNGLPVIFNEEPVSLILIESLEKGLFIKSYFHRYLKVNPYLGADEITAKVGEDFYENNSKNIGLSIFRREERKHHVSFTPTPPGVLFVGDPSFGIWKKNESGEKFWFFHRAYKDIPEILNWGKFRPSFDFYTKSTKAIEENTIYLGDNNEFGINGKYSQFTLNKIIKHKRINIDFIKHLKFFFSIP